MQHPNTLVSADLDNNILFEKPVKTIFQHAEGLLWKSFSQLKRVKKTTTKSYKTIKV